MEEIPLRNDDQAPPSNERQFPIVNTTEGIPRSLPRAADQVRVVDAVNEDREQHQEASEAVSYDLYMEKSRELHKLTLKMKQYEFAVQEAILFLSKPLNSYQDWIDREDSSRLGDSLAAALALPKAGSASRTSTVSATATPSKTQPSPHSKVFSFGTADSKQNQAANTSTVTPPQNENLSDLEVSCLENMRLCFNFLRNSQKSGKAIDDGTYSVPKDSQLNAMENESLALLESSRLSRDSTSSSQLPILKEENVIVGGSNSNLAASSSLSGRLSKTSKPNLLHPTTTTAAAAIVTTTLSYSNANVYDDHNIGGDLSLEQLADFKPDFKPSSTKCEKCRSALLALDEARDKLKASESKISDLESRLEKETKAKKVCQQAKNLIDQEIEEITAELFARANQMVVDESRRMDMLNTSNRELTKRVGDLTSRLREKEVELANATRSLYQAQSVQSHHSLNKYSVVGGGEEKGILRKSSSIVTAPPPPSLPVLPTNPLSFSEKQKVVVEEEEQATASLPSPSPPPQTSDPVSITTIMQQEKTPSPLPDTFTHYIISGFDAFGNNPAADGHLFSEFQDLIKSLVLTASLPSHQALLAIHSTAFMKRCLVESVEPCLYYSFTAAGAGQGPPKPSLFKKKVLEKVIKGQVVVAVDEGGGGSGGGGGKNKCCMCVMSRVCEYKLSFASPASTSTTSGGGTAIPQSSSSEPICRFCRDRVLAVQDFFAYLSFLASGTGRHGLTILSAFKQIMWTRRRMAVAVIGSCSLFESQVSAILGPGAGGNWEKDTKTLY